jgi:hypothetical protein
MDWEGSPGVLGDWVADGEGSPEGCEGDPGRLRARRVRSGPPGSLPA